MNQHVKAGAISPSWTDPNAAVEFLRLLRPNGPWVLSASYPASDAQRAPGDIGPMPTRTFRKLDQARTWIAARSGIANIYYTLNETGDVGKKPSKADIVDVNYLHVDIDSDEHGPLSGDQERKNAVVDRLKAHGVGVPTFIVDSGGGIQALWSIGSGNGSDEAKKHCALANQALIEELGGDYGTWNLDRLLRLPGTVNLPTAKKLKAGRTPLPTTLLSSSEASYEYWFFRATPEGHAAEAETEFEIGEAVEVDDIDSFAAQFDLPERIVEIIENGRLEEPKKKDDSRSVWLFDAVCGLVRAGVPPEMIVGIITDDRYRISESVLEKRDPVGDAERQVRSATSKVALGQAEFETDPDKKTQAWPRALRYSASSFTNNARNGRIFITKRPQRIVTSDGVIFSLQSTGIWAETKVAALRAEIRATNPKDSLQVHDIAAMVKAIEDLTQTSARPFEWIDPPVNAPAPKDLVLFRNGVLDITTGRLLPLDGSYFATALPGFDFDADAECPVWLKWIGERLEPSFHPTLQEWMGLRDGS